MDSRESEVKFKLRDERAGCYGEFAERGEEVINRGLFVMLIAELDDPQ